MDDWDEIRWDNYDENVLFPEETKSFEGGICVGERENVLGGLLS